ncbi:MAG: cyclic nucleotide-binding/CBS domain-containing protein [Candidatus Nanoarchaeia archaeon]
MKTGYKVSDIMTVNPIKLDFDETVQTCAEVMAKHNVGSMIIMKKDKFAGILTEEDIVTKVVAKDLTSSKCQVNEIMTPLNDIISIEPNKDITEAIELMTENSVRRLPVMTGTKFHGLITSKDILKLQPDLFELVSTSFELREEKRKLDALDQD